MHSRICRLCSCSNWTLQLSIIGGIGGGGGGGGVGGKGPLVAFSASAPPWSGLKVVEIYVGKFSLQKPICLYLMSYIYCMNTD